MIRIDALTGVRILAALGVFLSHVAAVPFLPTIPHTFMLSGYNGVTLFFTLSGFVLAWNYADRLARPTRHAVWSFAVARFARLYPLYLVALAIATVPFVLNGVVDPTLLLHVFSLQVWSPDVAVAFGYNGPGWSIGLEFFLYACFPLLVFVIAKVRRSALMVILIGAMAVVFALALIFVVLGLDGLPRSDPASAHHWLYRMPVTRLGDFVVGIVAALLIRGQAAPTPRLAVAAQVVGVISMVGLMSIPALQYSALSWDALYLVPAFLIIWGLAAGSATLFARILGSKPMVLLGEASFAFYLLHVPLLALMHVDGIDSTRPWLLVTALQLVIILLASIGAHIAIERPAQRYLRSRLDRTRASAS